MRKSSRLAEKQGTKLKNEDHEQPKAKKNRLDDKIQNIVRLDNGTMVNVFKFLNYCQLATSSIVSKQYCNLIRRHRKSLALLSVECRIERRFYDRGHTGIKIFNNKLSSEAYNEWAIYNRYSKQVSIKVPFELYPQGYKLSAFINYKGSNRNKTYTFLACIKELNHEVWPLFRHFVRLLADPFVYSRYVELDLQDEILSLFAESINSDCGRVQCGKLVFHFEDNSQKFISWITDHMCCDELRLLVFRSNRDKQLLDFLATGSHCASKIDVIYSHALISVMVGLVQKFMCLKACDENRVIGSIECYQKVNIDVLKRDYADFLVEGNINETSGFSWLIFEFVNNDIEKKLRLSIRIDIDDRKKFTLKISSL